MASAVIPILDEETGARRMVHVETNPEGDQLRLQAWRDREYERQHGQDDATARAIARGAASARTHAEAVEIVRSAAQAYDQSDAPAHRYIAGRLGAESRATMQQSGPQAAEAEREAARAEARAMLNRRSRERDRDR